MAKNPPSIPTLALVWLVGKLRGSKVIIDWHNLGYSILALNLGSAHIFVRLAKMSLRPPIHARNVKLKIAIRFEAYFGRAAHAHLFVTQAMHDFLVKEWKLQYEAYIIFSD
jgi:beta-1,4-mannosyltransferase